MTDVAAIVSPHVTRTLTARPIRAESRIMQNAETNAYLITVEVTGDMIQQAVNAHNGNGTVTMFINAAPLPPKLSKSGKYNTVGLGKATLSVFYPAES